MTLAILRELHAKSSSWSSFLQTDLNEAGRIRITLGENETHHSTWVTRE